MIVIAESKQEFNEICEISRYLHDFAICDLESRTFNFRFWTWFEFEDLTFSIWNYKYKYLDLDKYKTLNTLCHLYLIKTSEQNNELLKKLFYIRKEK